VESRGITWNAHFEQPTFDDIDERLPKKPVKKSSVVARRLCESLEQRETLTRLTTLLAGVLERNIEEEAALRFKRTLAARILGTGARIEACLPFLAPGDGARVILHVHALRVGLWQMSDPAPVVKRIWDLPDLGHGVPVRSYGGVGGRSTGGTRERGVPTPAGGAVKCGSSPPLRKEAQLQPQPLPAPELPPMAPSEIARRCASPWPARSAAAIVGWASLARS
jgi:hypothetical protein